MANYAVAEDHVQPAAISRTWRSILTEIAVTGVVAMREIHIKLQRNDELKDWSMEINGRLHEHVSDEGLTDLVEGALIVAAKSLVQSSGNARTLQGC
jgi:hypothetical protein